MRYLKKVLLVLLLCLFCCTSACQQSVTPLSIHAIKYGSSQFPAKQIFSDEKGPTSRPFAWLFYVIKFNGRVMLVDTGFSDENLAKKFGVDHQDPLELLKSELSIKPEDVTDIVLTHNHFDHIGCVPFFKKAKVYAHESAMKSKNAVFLPKDGRLVTFKDEYKLKPWLKIRHVGGHTQESSVLWLKSGQKTFLFTGDEAYLLENIKKARPLGFVYDKQKNAQFINEVGAMSGVRVLTFHSPEHVPAGEKSTLIYRSQ